jgi:hypothetical protein
VFWDKESTTTPEEPLPPVQPAVKTAKSVEFGLQIDCLKLGLLLQTLQGILQVRQFCWAFLHEKNVIVKSTAIVAKICLFIKYIVLLKVPIFLKLPFNHI